MIKQMLAVLMSACMIVSMLGCGAPQYEAGDIDVDAMGKKTGAVIANENKEPVSSEDAAEAIEAEKEVETTAGEYVFEATKQPESYASTVKGDAIEEAKIICEAVQKGEETITFSGMKCEESYVKIAFYLAELTYPACESVKLEQENEETYHLEYVLGVEKQLEINAQYEEAMTQLIKEVVKPEYTQEQTAYALYKYLVENFTVLDQDVDMSSEYVTEFGYLFDEDTSVCEAFLARQGSARQAMFVYMYLMNQLDIDCVMVGAIGNYKKQNISMIDSYFENNGLWPWLVVRIGGSSYHCDLMMDMMALYDVRSNIPEAEADIQYFGMGEEKRAESLMVISGQTMYVPNPTGSKGMPTCGDDMTGYEIN